LGAQSPTRAHPVAGRIDGWNVLDIVEDDEIASPMAGDLFSFHFSV
jgi:hypothetical protein